MQQLANAIQAHLDTLVDQYDARLQTMPGYVNFPAAARRDLECQMLKLIARCLTVGDAHELIQYSRQRATQWVGLGLDLAWFQQALVVPEEILVPLIGSIEASTFLWQALNRSQAAVWQLLAERLQQSEERFRRFSAATEEGLLFHEQGKILDVNPAMLALFGYSAVSDIIGRNMLEFIVPEQRGLVIQQMQLDSVTPYEISCIRKDGTTFPVETSTRAYQYGDQTVRASSVRDITGRKRAEDALRQSQQLLQTVMDNIPQAVFWKDRNLTYLGCNLAFAEDAGLTSPAEIVGKTDYDMPWQPQADLYRADDQRVVESGTARLNYEEPQTTATGEQTWLRTSKVPMRDAHNNITAVLGMYEDITARKRAEESLRDNEERLRAIYEGTNDAVMLLNERGFFDCNPRTLDMFGFKTREEFTAAHPADVSPQHQPDGQASLPAAQAHIQTAYRQGYDRFEWIHRRTNGEDFSAEVLLSAVDIGQQRVLQATVRDITERKQAEAALTQERSLLRTLIDNLPDQVFFKDTQGHIILYNEADARAMRVASTEEALGKTVYDLFPRELADRYHADDMGVIQSGIPLYNREEPGVDEAGQPRWILTTKVPLRDTQGNPIGLVGMARDITQQKVLEQSVRDSFERRGRQVEVSRQVSQEIAAAPDLNELFTRVVTLIKERFTYYHVQIFRYDPELDVIVLVTGYGEVGQHMLADEHRLPMGRGVVGTAAASGQSILATDVTQAEDWQPNPHLPETKGELAVPIKLRDQVLGILDVQSDRAGALTDDDRLLVESLCSQIAIAIEYKQTEAALAREQYLMDALMANATDTLYFKDSQSRFLRISQSHADKFGIADPAEAVGKSDFDFFTDEHARPAFEDEQQIIRTGQPIAREERETYADRPDTWVLTTKLPLRDEAGNIVGTFGISKDITERKLAEEAVRRSQAELSQALQIARLAYWEYDVTKDLFLFNDQFYAIFHTTAEQHGGYQLSSAYYAQHFVHPDDLALVGSEIEKALNSTDRHYSRSLEHRILYADGGVGYISVNINIDRDEQGKILRYYGANQDITDRKRAEQELAEERNRLRTLIDNLPVSVFIKDRDSRFVINNAVHLRLLGADSQEAVRGKWDFDFFPQELAAQYYADEQHLMQLGQPLVNHEEFVIDQISGERKWALSTKIPLRDTEGTVNGFLGFTQDITERKEAEAAIRRSEAELSEALKIANLAYWEYDVEKDLFQFNDQFFSIFHTTAEQHGGYQLSSAYYAQHFVYPDDLPIVGAEIEKALTSTDRHYSRQIDHRILYADGGVGYISVSINIDRDEQGHILRYYGANQDITEAKLAEEAVRRSEAELSEALKIAKLAYWEYDVEKDLFQFNDQFFSIFHTTAEQHGGYQLSSAYYAQHFVYPDDLPIVGAEIEKALNSTDRHYSHSLEHRILYADGGVGYISVSINIDRDEHGQILRYYGANQDITAAKLAEEAIRRSEAELSQALQIAKLAYWEYDVAKDLFLFNDQFFSIFHTTAEREGGYQLSSAQYAQKFVYPDDLPVVGSEIEKALNSTDQHYSRQLDHRVQYADGGIGYISVSINIDRDEQGQILRYYGANQDITEAKLAEAEREKLLTEQRKRALQLQTASEVSQATSSILSLDELLPQAAELVRTRFDLYYVGIFLNDESERWAVLRAGTGDAGQQMLTKGHKLRIGAASMISQCIAKQQARIALDVGEEAVRFDNPLLPLTRSELALPLISRGRVMGAVTIQSDQPAAFTSDDIIVLQTMADQISNAIENARLYEQSTAALQEVDALNRRLTGEGWETYLRRGLSQQVIWAGDDESIAPAALAAADEQLSAGQIVIESAPGDEQQTTVSVPVMLRGQTIGALRVAMPEAAYTDELRATLESLAGHVAQSAENARLLDETQARFARERALAEATDKIRRRPEVEHILQTAAEELARYLQASAINVRLGSSVTAIGETGQPG